MDYSVSVDGLDRPSIMVKLQLHHSQQNTPRLRRTLANTLKKTHPIHLSLNKFDKMGLKNTATILNIDVEHKNCSKLKTEIANYFFTLTLTPL